MKLVKKKKKLIQFSLSVDLSYAKHPRDPNKFLLAPEEQCVTLTHSALLGLILGSNLKTNKQTNPATKQDTFCIS